MTDPTAPTVPTDPTAPANANPREETDSEKSRRFYNECYAACIAGFHGVAKDELIDLAIQSGARPESDRQEMANKETEDSLRASICELECGNANGGGGGGSSGSEKATLDLNPPSTKALGP